MNKLDDESVDMDLRRAFEGYPQRSPSTEFRDRLVTRIQAEGRSRKAQRAVRVMRAYWAGMTLASSLVLYSLSINPSVIVSTVAIGFGATALVFAIPLLFLERGTLSSLLLRTIGDQSGA